MKIEVKDGLGDHRTPGWIEVWSLNGGQDGLFNRQVLGLGVRYVRYIRYTSRALGLSAFRGTTLGCKVPSGSDGSFGDGCCGWRARKDAPPVGCCGTAADAEERVACCAVAVDVRADGTGPGPPVDSAIAAYHPTVRSSNRTLQLALERGQTK